MLRIRPTRFNRTFMELKVTYYGKSPGISLFQSHLYGIERPQHGEAEFMRTEFQSHLYGIESNSGKIRGSSYLVSIAPLWN